MKIFTNLVAFALAVAAQAAEFHVAKSGNDTNIGSPTKPLLTIQRAADLAQPGDTITVHAGVYRERVSPPRGGTSDGQRIIYRAAAGEAVAIKGSEVVTGWKQVANDTWTVTLPNSFFGDFNPYSDVLEGHALIEIAIPACCPIAGANHPARDIQDRNMLSTLCEYFRSFRLGVPLFSHL